MSHSSLWQKGIGPRSPELLDHSLRSARAIGSTEKSKRKRLENLSAWRGTRAGIKAVQKERHPLCEQNLENSVCPKVVFFSYISWSRKRLLSRNLVPLFSDHRSYTNTTCWEKILTGELFLVQYVHFCFYLWTFLQILGRKSRGSLLQKCHLIFLYPFDIENAYLMEVICFHLPRAKKVYTLQVLPI